jgi:hypothetical protein
MRSVFRGRYLVGLQLKDDRSRVVCHSRDTTWPVALDDRDRRSARNFTAEVSRAGYVAMLFGVLVSLVVGIELMTVVFCRGSSDHDRERGAQLGRPTMRKLVTTVALLALVDSPAAIAQTAGSRNPAAPPLANSARQLLPEAPVGHRQPRADQVPPEKNLMDPNDPVNRENAAVDRMIRGICRGC